MTDKCSSELNELHDHVLRKVFLICIGGMTGVVAATEKYIAWQGQQNYTGDALLFHQNWYNAVNCFFEHFRSWYSVVKSRGSRPWIFPSFKNPGSGP